MNILAIDIGTTTGWARSSRAGTAGSVPKEALSPLGEEIRNIENRTDSAVDRLEGLLNGLAL